MKEPIITIEKEAREVYSSPFLLPNDPDRTRLRKKYADNKDQKLIITVTEKPENNE
jgi:hypothetical protein